MSVYVCVHGLQFFINVSLVKEECITFFFLILVYKQGNVNQNQMNVEMVQKIHSCGCY